MENHESIQKRLYDLQTKVDNIQISTPKHCLYKWVSVIIIAAVMVLSICFLGGYKNPKENKYVDVESSEQVTGNVKVIKKIESVDHTVDILVFMTFWFVVIMAIGGAFTILFKTLKSENQMDEKLLELKRALQKELHTTMLSEVKNDADLEHKKREFEQMTKPQKEFENSFTKDNKENK